MSQSAEGPSGAAGDGAVERIVDDAHRLVVALRRASRSRPPRCSIRDLEETLTRTMESAVETIATVDAGSIFMIGHGCVTTRFATAGRIAELDRAQREWDEGPCVDAIEDPPDSGIVVVADLAVDGAARWPRFAPVALGAGYRSLMSTRISPTREPYAALTLYSGVPHGFDDHALVLAALLGAQASLLLYGVAKDGSGEGQALLGRGREILTAGADTDVAPWPDAR